VSAVLLIRAKALNAGRDARVPSGRSRPSQLRCSSNTRRADCVRGFRGAAVCLWGPSSRRLPARPRVSVRAGRARRAGLCRTLRGDYNAVARVGRSAEGGAWMSAGVPAGAGCQSGRGGDLCACCCVEGEWSALCAACARARKGPRCTTPPVRSRAFSSRRIVCVAISAATSSIRTKKRRETVSIHLPPPCPLRSMRWHSGRVGPVLDKGRGASGRVRAQRARCSRCVCAAPRQSCGVPTRPSRRRA